MKADNNKQKIKYMLIAVVFWLLVWQLLSMAVASRVLLPGPVNVLISLAKLCITGVFWRSIGTSFIHIVSGFLMALVLGTLLAVISGLYMPVKIIVSPIMKLIKAVPVASFIILVLLWVHSAGVPLVVSFLMVLPVIYVNVLTGIEETDKGLLEMAGVYRLSPAKRLKYIYVPSVRPHFISAVNVGLGFCWKSGVAAEVIALSPGTIGRNLYDAKLYLMTDELFAWTVTIVLISVAFEAVVMRLIDRLGAGGRKL